MILPIYDINHNDTARFSLGDTKGNTLFVLSLNPSRATNTHLDPTLKNVDAFRSLLGFDSFLMLNLYPQRATDPINIHKRRSRKLLDENLRTIGKYVTKGSTIWASWGDLIETRSFLKDSLLDIYETIGNRDLKWIMYDSPTKKGHPKHPSRKNECMDVS